MKEVAKDALFFVALAAMMYTALHLGQFLGETRGQRMVCDAICGDDHGVLTPDPPFCMCLEDE